MCGEFLEGIADSDVTDDEIFNNAGTRRESFESESEAVDERPSKKPRIDDTSEEESEFPLQVISATDPESENFEN